MAQHRIFYHCYDSNRPSGGQKDTYQHVDILNRHGFHACVLHDTPGFRLTWFENETRVACSRDVSRDQKRDVLVLPEDMGARIGAFPGRKVIFNKGIYRGFQALGPSEQAGRIYLSRDVVAVLGVSEHNLSYLRFAYPDAVLLLVELDIRPDLFSYRALPSKKCRVTYDTKAASHVMTLYHLLQGRAAQGLNKLDLVEWICLSGLPEREVAEILRETFIFLFLSVDEGLGRMPLEAMASGCLVYAYDGGPLSYLPAAYRFPYGDLISMANSIERAVAAFPDGLSAFNRLTEEGRRIAERYSASEQERSVLDAWERILTLV